MSVTTIAIITAVLTIIWIWDLVKSKGKPEKYEVWERW